MKHIQFKKNSNYKIGGFFLSFRMLSAKSLVI